MNSFSTIAQSTKPHLGPISEGAYNHRMVSRNDTNFTVDEAQKAMGLTPARMEKLIEEGKIEVIRDGWKVLVPRQAILDYLAEVSAIPLKQREGRK
jgi:excisionase family DNA binding protein